MVRPRTLIPASGIFHDLHGKGTKTHRSKHSTQNRHDASSRTHLKRKESMHTAGMGNQIQVVTLINTTYVGRQDVVQF